MIHKSKKIITAGIFSTIIGAYLMGVFAHADTSSTITAKDKLESYLKFTQIISLIEQEYVDEVNTTALIDKALQGLLTNLDAHSSYMNQADYKDLSVQTKGEFGGLGISIGMKENALTVIAPLDGTPAFKAGVKAGDIILKIDEKATLGMNIDDSIKLMRGKPGTKVTLTIIRDNEAKPLIVPLIRDIIEIQSVYVRTIEDQLLYLHITSFDQKVTQKIEEALKEHPKTKGIILDLRNNPGGLLDQAVDLVDLFVSKGVIVSQKGRVEEETIEYRATSKNDIKTPIVVIINAGSASASEIVSGALQDLKRAVIVGEKSFGKGSVQVVIPINQQQTEALKLTVARYYLPSGRTIQAEGVAPDITVHSGAIEYNNDPALLKEESLQKHLKQELKKINITSKKEKENNTTTDDENSTIITETQLYKDAQLKSAVDILKALIITKGTK